jgi:anti-anti-sigma factor
MHTLGQTGQGEGMTVTREVKSLRLAGRLDASNVSEVRRRINDVIESEPAGNVVVDLTGVDIVDATGLGVLAAAHVRLQREGRRLVLRGCGVAVRRTLAVTRLLRVLYVEQASRQT